jgi:hypothetical protein
LLVVFAKLFFLYYWILITTEYVQTVCVDLWIFRARIFWGEINENSLSDKGGNYGVASAEYYQENNDVPQAKPSNATIASHRVLRHFCVCFRSLSLSLLLRRTGRTTPFLSLWIALRGCKSTRVESHIYL